MEVTSPPGTVLGSIEQVWSIFPTFNVKNTLGETVLTIRGPFCPISCCGDVNFEVVLDLYLSPLFKLNRKW